MNSHRILHLLRPSGLLWGCSLGIFIALSSSLRVEAQTAVLADAWWTYQQDCNGDGCVAGLLPGERARLNWTPNVFDCNGTLTVYEIVYARSCGAAAWTPIYTNSAHAITGCRSSNAQSFDVALAGNCVCNEYQIELYRVGQTAPDDVRSPANDPDLAQHREQWIAQDFCLSDYFATCASLSGTVGSRTDNNTAATKEPGEPDHAGNAGGKSLWYCWTAAASTPVTFDTLGSSFDTLLAVYTGPSVSSLSLIASNDDIGGWTNRFSRVIFTPTPGTTYHIAVDGYGGASGIVVLNWNQSGAALPDLVIWGQAVSPTIITRTFTNTDCEVVEGCEIPGTRTLLSFTTETRNIGAGDLALGDPSTNALFSYASCHGHYHFESFASYALLDTNGTVVASGHKVGFCLTDDHPWSTSANPQAKYNCTYQGIQSGWADIYAAGLPCQYVDITGLAPGDYLLQLVVNPAGLIAESDTNNNITLVPVNIPPALCASAPPNDSFANAQVVGATPFSFSEFNNCATKEPGEPNHAGDPGGHSVWFTWTPSVSQNAVITTKGSDFDTLLAVYTGDNVAGLSLVASNDDIIYGVYQQSQLSFAATAGTTYQIAVDGFGGAVGTVVLNINPPANDDFADAQVIAGLSGSASGFNLAASKEPYEPAHAGDVGGHSVWFRWTAPATGPVDFNTRGSTFDTTLAVYTGDTVTNLTSIAGNNNDVGGVITSRVDFWAVAGATYQIAVDGAGKTVGNLSLNWNMVSQLAVVPLVGQAVRIDFTGVEWQRYGLLTATNLAQPLWSTQLSRTMSGGSQQVTNTTGAPAQFYRTIRLP